MSLYEMPTLIHEIQEWQKRTFPASTPAGAIRHMREEIEEMEIEEDPDNLEEECADVFFMLCQFVALKKVDLTNAVIKKLDKNKARKWGEPSEDGVYYHVKDGDT